MAAPTAASSLDPRPPTRADALAPIAWAPVLAVAAVAVLALALTANRYGYHRDELYFIAAGAHPALGYPDQPLFSPLLARAMDLLAPGSLLVLRAPAILAVALTVVTTALLAREAGGGRRAQVLAAACWAAGGICLVTGHFLTTTTYDVAATAIVTLLIARALRSGDPRWWTAAGGILGLALLNKSLVAIVVAGVLAALLVAGPRRGLRSRWAAAGALLAVLGAAPYASWQLRHGLPQQDLARSIAADGAQGGRVGFIPFQFLLIGPLLAPVWIAGLLALWRDPALRPLRCFALAYPLLTVVFIATGGKAYYMSGLLPLLLGAGAVVVDRWIARKRRRVGAVGAAVVVTAAISAVIGLCLLPADRLQGSPIIAVNPDVGEMVGWPRFADTVARVYHGLPGGGHDAVVFTQNYGEAGAIAHFGPERGLPIPYSGHNGWALWGPPPDGDRRVVLVGLDARQAARDFTGCRLRARIDDGVGLDNQEQGEPVWACSRERRPWSALWPSLRHYD